MRGGVAFEMFEPSLVPMMPSVMIKASCECLKYLSS